MPSAMSTAPVIACLRTDEPPYAGIFGVVIGVLALCLARSDVARLVK